MSVMPNEVKVGESVKLTCGGVIPAGKMVTWYKRQGYNAPDIVGFNNVISNPAYVDKFTAGESQTEGDNTIYTIDIECKSFRY